MTYEDLMEAIADRISELWPERMLYRDFCPSDFKRPSGFLYVVKAGYTDANAGLVRWDFSAELTLYAATDAYTVESTEALRADQNKVLRQFGGPAVSVGDRHIMVGVSAEAPGPGEAYVGFRASWFDEMCIRDSIKPHRGSWPLFIDPANHQSLCKRCHDQKTAREQAEERRKRNRI